MENPSCHPRGCAFRRYHWRRSPQLDSRWVCLGISGRQSLSRRTNSQDLPAIVAAIRDRGPSRPAVRIGQSRRPTQPPAGRGDPVAARRDSGAGGGVARRAPPAHAARPAAPQARDRRPGKAANVPTRRRRPCYRFRWQATLSSFCWVDSGYRWWRPQRDSQICGTWPSGSAHHPEPQGSRVERGGRAAPSRPFPALAVRVLTFPSDSHRATVANAECLRRRRRWRSKPLC